LGSAISTTPSHQILQVIQAKILLVDYLFSIGQFAAALHEAHSASSLAVASGLHKIRTAQPIPAHTSFIDRIDLTLREPRDQIEEGERINAFWAVFLMDRCLSVMFGPPLVISDMDAPGMQIDTPWPLEMETYERVGTITFQYTLLKLVDLLRFSGTDISEYAYERDCA
jgi:Fungal specific transcription factor domain